MMVMKKTCRKVSNVGISLDPLALEGVIMSVWCTVYRHGSTLLSRPLLRKAVATIGHLTHAFPQPVNAGLHLCVEAQKPRHNRPVRQRRSRAEAFPSRWLASTRSLPSKQASTLAAHGIRPLSIQIATALGSLRLSRVFSHLHDQAKHLHDAYSIFLIRPCTSEDIAQGIARE